ncbi:hypothetical protein Tco_1159829 [Tanacetum coccineum]
MGRRACKREMGGLGIGSLRAKNLSLLVKWRWRMVMEPDALWAKVIRGIYGETGSFELLSNSSLRVKGHGSTLQASLRMFGVTMWISEPRGHTIDELGKLIQNLIVAPHQIDIKNVVFKSLAPSESMLVGKALQGVMWWLVWKWQNRVVHASKDDRRAILLEDIFTQVQHISLLWLSNRCLAVAMILDGGGSGGGLEM